MHDEEIAAIRKEELAKRELLIERFGEQTEALRREIEETLGMEIARLRAELSRTSADLAHYKAEYLKAISSRSWKLTAPLRSEAGWKQTINQFLRHAKPD